jgi:hypothetical protein
MVMAGDISYSILAEVQPTAATGAGVGSALVMKMLGLLWWTYA